MEKYKYGPLIYVTKGMNEDEGNFFWAGPPPVGYDEMGIPIDESGLQCLDISCPLHPGWEPTELVQNEFLKWDVPTLEYTRQWFEDNFLVISDYQLKKCIIKCWHTQALKEGYGFNTVRKILKQYSSVEQIMEAAWPDEQPS